MELRTRDTHESLINIRAIDPLKGSHFGARRVFGGAVAFKILLPFIISEAIVLTEARIAGPRAIAAAAPRRARPGINRKTQQSETQGCSASSIFSSKVVFGFKSARNSLASRAIT